MRRSSFWVAGFLCVFFLAFNASAGDGRCLTVNMYEPFELPDGSMHTAGTLRLCHKGTHSPSAVNHETYVDDTPVGIFASHEGTHESGPHEYAVIFYRGSDSKLRLSAYTVPEVGGTIVYHLDRPRVRTEEHIRAEVVVPASTPARQRAPAS